METWKQSSIVFEGKVVRLRTGSVSLDDDTTAYREVVEHPGGVCILPYTGDAFIFVRQYRIALGQYLIEAPAGKLEPDETPEMCARKELHEETGFEAGEFIFLGKIFSSVGFCNEAIHLYLARNLREIGRQLEPEERIESVVMPLESVRKNMETDFFMDGKTAVLVQRALLWLSHNPG